MTDTLLKMKQEIDSAKSRRERLEGELSGLMDQLKNKYGFTSIEEADDAIIKLEAEISEAQESLTSKLEKLKSSYEWATI